MECFINRPWDCTQQERIVRTKIFTLHGEHKCRVTAIYGRTNVELPRFIRHGVAVGSGMETGETLFSEACENPHFKAKVRIIGSEIREILGVDRRVF